MLFDLHVHQDKHSLDSKLNINDAINEAKTKGLDGICITDHDDLGLRPFAKYLSAYHNLLVIVGVEIYTLDGDLLCYGIDELPTERLSAKETINYVHEHGGVCIAAHPYRKNNRGVKDLIKTLNLDAIEVYNGRTDDASNEIAYSEALELGLPMTGSSDAHSVGEIGCYVTEFEEPVYSEEDFIRAIKLGKMTYQRTYIDEITA
ncbi:MAG: PHP domain-containing protein [Clostridiales bacterium]|nr:PHP domain-containing protein [Clostridiales bacterium]